MLLTYLQRNQYQWELTYVLQYEMANRLNYKHQRKNNYSKRSEGPPIPHA
jgi:hypothetical protein